MAPSTEELQEQLAELAREIAALRRRLDRIEGGGPTPPTASTASEREAEPAPPAETVTPRRGTDVVGYLSIAGRTLMIFAGAYLLRALTDGGILSSGAGTTLGLIYAAMLLFLCERAAGADRVISANAYGFNAVAVAFPLIAETASRLQILSPTLAALIMAAFIGAGFWIAWGRSLLLLAWLTELFALGTALVLVRETGVMMPFVLTTFFLCLAAEVVAFDDRFMGLRWPGAIAIDVVLFVLTTFAVRRAGMPEGLAPVSPTAVVAALIALPALYIATIGSRTIVRGRLVQAFGVFQGTMALIIGLWGAARVLAFHGASERWVGGAAVILALSMYGVAFTYAAVHKERARNYYFYSSLGGLQLLAGTAWLTTGAVLGLIWSGLASATMVLGTVYRRRILQLHAAILAILSTVATGLLTAASEGFVGKALVSWSPIGAAALDSLAIVLLCYGILIATRRSAPHPVELIPNLLLGAVALFCLAGLLARGIAQLLIQAPGPATDIGLLAAVRTGVLAVAAIALAILSRAWRTSELRWFVAPVLLAGALKIVAEDFPKGRPVTQFLTLALYGAALIIVPRLMRTGRPRAEAPPESRDSSAS